MTPTPFAVVVRAAVIGPFLRAIFGSFQSCQIKEKRFGKWIMVKMYVFRIVGMIKLIWVTSN